MISLKKFNDMYKNDNIKLIKQNNNLKTIFPKRNASDGLINGDLSSKHIYNFIRASLFHILCFFYYEKMKIKIISSEVFKYEKKYEKISCWKYYKVIPHLGCVIKCKNSTILIKEISYEKLPIMLFSTFLKYLFKIDENLYCWIRKSFQNTMNH